MTELRIPDPPPTNGRVIAFTYFVGDQTQVHPAWTERLTLPEICAKYFAQPHNRLGIKNQNYITRGECLGTRCDANIAQADLLVIDGDQTEADPSSCIPIEQAHHRLYLMDLNHIIHTTASNAEGRHKWRAYIPCSIPTRAALHVTTATIMGVFNASEPPINQVKLVHEMNTWSQPWFMPSTQPDGIYSVYSYYIGEDLIASEAPPQPQTAGVYSFSDEPKYRAAIHEINNRGAIHPNVITLGNYFANNHVSKPFAKTMLTELITHSGRDARTVAERLAQLDKNLNDCYKHVEQAIAALPPVDTSALLASGSRPASPDQSGQAEPDNPGPVTGRLPTEFTQMPTPGGAMWQVVQWVLSIQFYPNLTIAIIVAEHLVSVFGGGHWHIAQNTTTRKRIMLAAQGTGKNIINRALSMIVKCLGEKNMLTQMPWIFRPEEYLGSDAFSFSVPHQELQQHRVRSFVVNEAGAGGSSRSGDVATMAAYQLQVLSLKADGISYPRKYSQMNKIVEDNQLQPVYGGVWVYLHESTLNSYAALLTDSDAVESGALSRSDIFFINPYIHPPNTAPVNIVPPHIRNLFVIMASDFRDQGNEFGLDENPAWDEIDYSQIIGGLAKVEAETRAARNQATANNDGVAVAMYVRRYERILTSILICACADAAAESEMPPGKMIRPVARQHHLDYAIARVNSIEDSFIHHTKHGGALSDDVFSQVTNQFVERANALCSNIQKARRAGLKFGQRPNTIGNSWVLTYTAYTRMLQRGPHAKMVKTIYNGDLRRARAAFIEHLIGLEFIAPVMSGKGAESSWWFDQGQFPCKINQK